MELISIALLVELFVYLRLSLDSIFNFVTYSRCVSLTSILPVCFVWIVHLHTESFESIVVIAYIAGIDGILSSLFLLTESSTTPSHLLHQHCTFIIFT